MDNEVPAGWIWDEFSERFEKVVSGPDWYDEETVWEIYVPDGERLTYWLCKNFDDLDYFPTLVRLGYTGLSPWRSSVARFDSLEAAICYVELQISLQY